MPSNNIKNNRRVGQGHGPNRVVEKPKNFKKAVKEIINYCKPYMIVIIIALLLAAFSSIFTILGPNKLRDLTNEIVKGVMTGINFTNVKNITIYLVVLYGLSFVFNYLQGFIMATVTNKFSKRIRKEIINKVNNLPLKYFDKHSYGDLLSRITNDVDTLGITLYNSVAPLVSALTLFIGTLYMMFRTNYQMAFTSVGATLIGFILMIIILSKSQKYFVMQQKELGNINGHIEEIYSGHNIVKVYNGINEANNKFDSINERLYKSAKNSQFLSGLMQPIMSFIGNFGYVAVCVVGASLVLNNTITIGTIVAFMIYIRLFSLPLGQIAQAMNQLQSAAAASERVFEFLGEKEMPKEDVKVVLDPKEVKGNIEFKNVKFGYDEDKVIIKDFNAKVKSGEKVAIVGPTGAGKTTMVNLLMKFYDINSGDILIDGISINDLSRENIHDLFIMVLQDTWLFNGSVKENIVFNKENVSDEEIDEACKTVGIDHFVKTLPHNYETILSDSESISAGQKQLLTIARGMIKNAPFLILDEATSSVDTRTEELVQKAMDKLTEGRTSFIIAHRLSTIKNADLILVMNEGNIIEQGTHSELLKKNGFYANLYNSQFEKVE